MNLAADIQTQLEGLDGLITHATGMRLAELAAAVPHRFAIVEIGSFKGKSGCYLGAGARAGNEAHVFCVDPWDLDGNVYGKHGFTDPQVQRTFIRQRDELGLTFTVTPIQAFSLEAAAEWETPIGLLYIDGDHEYDSVKADFEAWLPHVPLEGVVAFDDYGTRNKGVTRFVDELAGYGWHVDLDTLPLAICTRPLT